MFPDEKTLGFVESMDAGRATHGVSRLYGAQASQKAGLLYRSFISLL